MTETEIYNYLILFSILCPPLQTFCKNTSEALKFIFRSICSASKCMHAWRTGNLPESHATVRTSTPVAILQQHFATGWKYSIGHISLFNSVSSFLEWLTVATKRFYYPGQLECITLKDCTKDVTGHLKTLNLSADEGLGSEIKLLLARAGKYHPKI